MYTSFGPGAIGIDLPLPEAAALAARHGFDAIQVDQAFLTEHGPARWNEVLESNGLRAGSAGLPVPVHGEDEAFEDALEALPDHAARIAATGCRRCSTYILPFSDERPYDAQFDHLVARLSPVVEVLAAHDIRLGLEFVGPETSREGHAYPFIYDIEGMLELCAAIDATHTGLLLDCWHWYTSGDTVETLSALSAEEVIDVHINDAPDHIPRESVIDSERELPGATGVIDIEAFLTALDRMGYDGPVMVEPFSDELEALSPEAATARTMESIETVWERAGL